MTLTQQDIETTGVVGRAMGYGFITAGRAILPTFESDPAISPLGMLLGVAQAHIDGLAAALANLEPVTRENVIATFPAQLRAIIERTGP